MTPAAILADLLVNELVGTLARRHATDALNQIAKVTMDKGEDTESAEMHEQAACELIEAMKRKGLTIADYNK